jgi:hypothetical protein
MQPLVVDANGFRGGERVRVTLNARVTRTRTIAASAAGAFRLSFGEVPVSRCERFSVVAAGRSGTKAQYKHIPLPACSPA